MDRNVKGKTVVITGSAEGLGLAMINSFLKHGAKLVISLDMNEELGKKSVADLKQQYGNKVFFYKCNVITDLDAVYELIIRKHHKIDILINNAGVLDELSIRTTIEVNTIALMEWSIKFYDHMRTDKGGSGGTIINISSVFGFKFSYFTPYYHASKSAVIGFSRSLGHETNCKNTGVRTVVICPGFTYTKLPQNVVIRDSDMLPEVQKVIDSSFEWQEADVVGKGAVEIFEKAESGSVWVVEGSRPPEKLNVQD